MKVCGTFEVYAERDETVTMKRDNSCLETVTVKFDFVQQFTLFINSMDLISWNLLFYSLLL